MGNKKKVYFTPLLDMLGDPVPEDPPVIEPVQRPKIKVKVSGGNKVVVVYDGDRETMHWACESRFLESVVSGQESEGRHCAVFESADYYRRRGEGEFQLA